MENTPSRLGIPDPMPDSKSETFVSLLYRKESDRGCVLIGVSYLDSCLELLFQKRFSAAPKKIVKALLSDPFAPLGTFSARIKLAHAFELVNSNVCVALEILREIRNKCAHAFSHFEWPTKSIESAYEILADVTRELRSIAPEQWDGLFQSLDQLHINYKTLQDTTDATKQQLAELDNSIISKKSQLEQIKNRLDEILSSFKNRNLDQRKVDTCLGAIETVSGFLHKIQTSEETAEKVKFELDIYSGLIAHNARLTFIKCIFIVATHINDRINKLENKPAITSAPDN